MTSMILPRTKSFDSSPSVNPLNANQLHKLQPPQPQPQHAAAQAVPNAKRILQQMQLQVQRGAEEPFYVVDLNSAVERLQLWRALLPDVQPFYAVKCNPDALLLSTLAVHGASFDCASRAEMQAVLADIKAKVESGEFAGVLVHGGSDAKFCEKARLLSPSLGRGPSLSHLCAWPLWPLCNIFCNIRITARALRRRQPS